ncbi:MAG: hypothetical protein R3B99_06050 [Polyangiales bacterium]
MDIVESLADRGLEVGLSSLRADRLNDRLMAALARAGHRILTTASDGASQRLRDKIQRRARADVLACGGARAKARHEAHEALHDGRVAGRERRGHRRADRLFDGALAHRAALARHRALCAKRNTPLDGEGFAGIDVVEKRLARLRKGVKGKVDLRATSARWAWIEYVLAQGGQAEGRGDRRGACGRALSRLEERLRRCRRIDRSVRWWPRRAHRSRSDAAARLPVMG